MSWKFRVGQRVVKVTGYPFPGIVVAAFTTCAGAERYVVEFWSEVTDEPSGLCHIFSPEQLEGDDRFDSDGGQIAVKVPKGDKGREADPRRDPDVEVRQTRAAVRARQGLPEEDAP